MLVRVEQCSFLRRNRHRREPSGLALVDVVADASALMYRRGHQARGRGLRGLRLDREAEAIGQRPAAVTRPTPTPYEAIDRSSFDHLVSPDRCSCGQLITGLPKSRIGPAATAESSMAVSKGLDNYQMVAGGCQTSYVRHYYQTLWST